MKKGLNCDRKSQLSEILTEPLNSLGRAGQGRIETQIVQIGKLYTIPMNLLQVYGYQKCAGFAQVYIGWLNTSKGKNDKQNFLIKIKFFFSSRSACSLSYTYKNVLLGKKRKLFPKVRHCLIKLHK